MTKLISCDFNKFANLIKSHDIVIDARYRILLHIDIRKYTHTYPRTYIYIHVYVFIYMKL